MGKLCTSILMALTVSAVVAILSSCASKETKSATVQSYSDESVLEDVTPTVTTTADLEVDHKTENKKVTASVEDNLLQAIKKQNDTEISKTASDLLMVNPTHLKALNALGLLNYKKGHFKAAEYFFGKALKTHSNEAGLYNNLALVKLAQNESREAVKLLKAGLAQKPNDANLLANLGAIYVSQKDYTNAEIALEPLFKSGIKENKILINYAVSLAALKKNTEATDIYRKLLVDNPSSREIMLNYSVHLVENLKDYKQGIDLINRLKFVGVPDGARNIINDLENKAKSGLK